MSPAFYACSDSEGYTVNETCLNASMVYMARRPIPI